MAAETAAEVVARCRELARISDEAGPARARVRRPGDGAGERARGALDGRGRDGACASTPRGNLVGPLPGSEPGGRHAAARLAPRHGPRRRRVRRAARRARRRSPCVARLRARGGDAAVRRRRARLLRRGGPALRHRVPRQPRRWRGRSTTALLGRRRRRRRDACARRSAATPADASRRGERLLGYCEVHIEQGPVLEERGAPVGGRRGDRGRDARGGARSRAARATPGRCRWRCGATRRARSPSSCSRSRRRAAASPGWWPPSGSWRCVPGAPNVIPGGGGGVARRAPRRRRRARGTRWRGLRRAGGGDRRGARASRLTWEDAARHARGGDGRGAERRAGARGRARACRRPAAERRRPRRGRAGAR